MRRISMGIAILCIWICIAGAPAVAEEVFPLQGRTLVKAILREGPSTGTRQVQVFSADAEVIVLGRVENWYQVQRNQYAGYIREDLLTLLGPSDALPVYADAPVFPEITPEPLPETMASPTPEAVTPTSAVIGGTLGLRILRQGSRGDDVRQLQQLLLQRGYNPRGVDGSFGMGTYGAVVQYQVAQGLVADGIVGPSTANALRTSATPVMVSPPATVQPVVPAGSRVLRNGSRGEDVRQLQQRLYELGYLGTAPTGNYLTMTMAAVRSFQGACGLQVDGIAGINTQRALYADTAPAIGTVVPVAPDDTAIPSPTAAPTPAPVVFDKPAPGTYKLLQKGSNGDAVRQLQQALANLGYYSGTISGTYDSATTAAVKAFQQNNGTGVDGVAGTATQTILYERTPRPAWEAAPTPVPRAPGVGEMSGPATSQVELAHWFNDVKKNYRAGQIYTVYDPATGLGWALKFYAMGNHADSEPLTQQDTDIMYKAFGNTNTWNPKPVYARMPDGRWILATMHNTPHLSGSIKTNGFDGHLCVHFYRDMDEVRKNDPNYGVQNQNVLRAHWEKIKH